MSNVVAFPSPMSNQRTPVAVEVIVAPAADLWVAWLLLPCGRYVALERTPDKGHALQDARAYSTRHRCIPVSVLNKPLAVVLDQSTPSRRRRGEISIWPDQGAGGRWYVDHTSTSGDSIGLVGTTASLDEAVVLARDAAMRLSATFDDPHTPLGGTA